jgi:hypothetical protein
VIVNQDLAEREDNPNVSALTDPIENSIITMKETGSADAISIPLEANHFDMLPE